MYSTGAVIPFDGCYAFHVQMPRRETLPRLEVPTEHV